MADRSANEAAIDFCDSTIDDYIGKTLDADYKERVALDPTAIPDSHVTATTHLSSFMIHIIFFGAR